MTQPTATADIEQTALEAMLDALLAIVEAEAAEAAKLAELSEPNVLIPFPTVL